MKKKRFAVEQIVAVLKEAEAGMPAVDLAWALREFTHILEPIG